MERADELILLGSLYNKIKERVQKEELTAEIFKKKVNTLIAVGNISEEVAKSVERILIPKEKIKYEKEMREKIKEELKHEIKANGNIFSSKKNSEKAKNLIDEILSDDEMLSKSTIANENEGREDYKNNERFEDPCFNPYSYRATPSC